jgi:proteasome alpha subunit
VLTYSDGVLFVAENRSTALHKVSEIYDRIGFAAVGRYNEFENLRTAGIRLADVRGYSYDRRDVTGKWLANAYAQTMGAIFTEQQKPFEVELCVAEVGKEAESDQLYRITYDGSISDEPGFVVMGGHTEPISAQLRESYQPGMELADAVAVALSGLQSATPGGAPAAGGAKPAAGAAKQAAGSAKPAAGGTNGGDADRLLGVNALEVAVLDRRRPRRAFRRITGAALAALLPAENRATGAEETPAVGGDADAGGPQTGGAETGGAETGSADTGSADTGSADGGGADTES